MIKSWQFVYVKALGHNWKQEIPHTKAEKKTRSGILPVTKLNTLHAV
jgi:hypothetical protein